MDCIRLAIDRVKWRTVGHHKANQQSGSTSKKGIKFLDEENDYWIRLLSTELNQLYLRPFLCDVTSTMTIKGLLGTTI
jgi:hypothetical protein